MRLDEASSLRPRFQGLWPEHFIVIIAKVIKDNKVYYRFFDPGSVYGAKKGYNENNLLSLGDDISLQGDKPSSDKKYTMSQIRQNK